MYIGKYDQVAPDKPKKLLDDYAGMAVIDMGISDGQAPPVPQDSVSTENASGASTTNDAESDASAEQFKKGKHPGSEQKGTEHFRYFEEADINFDYNLEEIAKDIKTRGLKDKGNKLLNFNSRFWGLYCLDAFTKKGIFCTEAYQPKINIAHFILIRYMNHCLFHFHADSNYGFKANSNLAEMRQDFLDIPGEYDQEFINKMQYFYYYIDRKIFFSWVNSEGYNKIVNKNLNEKKVITPITSTPKSEKEMFKFPILIILFSMVSGIPPHYVGIKQSYDPDTFEKFIPKQYVIGCIYGEDDESVSLFPGMINPNRTTNPNITKGGANEQDGAIEQVGANEQGGDTLYDMASQEFKDYEAYLKNPVKESPKEITKLIKRFDDRITEEAAAEPDELQKKVSKKIEEGLTKYKEYKTKITVICQEITPDTTEPE